MSDDVVKRSRIAFLVMFDPDHGIAESRNAASAFQPAHCRAGAADTGSVQQHRASPAQAQADLAASRMRWLSPPDKVAGPAADVRYSEADIMRKFRRSLISFRMRAGDWSRSGCLVSVFETCRPSPASLMREIRRRPKYPSLAISPPAPAAQALAATWPGPWRCRLNLSPLPRASPGKSPTRDSAVRVRIQRPRIVFFTQ